VKADAAALDATVVIPTRDRWGLLRRGLASALGQIDVHHEVIVVDDGSRDETAAGLARLEDPRLRIIRNETSRGVANARNTGIAQARGRWVAFLDDDDLWSPHALRLRLEAAEAQRGRFVYCDSLVLDQHYEVTGCIRAPEPADLPTALQRWNVIGGPSAVAAETSILRALGGFDDSFSVFADWDLWLRLTDAAPGAHCSRPLVGYVQHPGGMFSRHPKQVAVEFRRLERTHQERRASGGLGPQRALMLHELAYGHARAGRRGRALWATLRSGSPRYAALGVAFLGGHDFAIRVRNRMTATRIPPAPGWLRADPPNVA
jgi:glycosyltransferase involved in cell wall biosynthesis